MAKNASDVAAKWSKNLASSGDSIRQGVQNVTQAPTQKAAQNVNAYVNGVNQAAASGKWQRGLNRVSLQDWQNATLQKGLPRITSGATAGKSKMESFMTQFLPHVDQLQNVLASMPRGDIEQNKARMLAAVDHMAKFKRS